MKGNKVICREEEGERRKNDLRRKMRTDKNYIIKRKQINHKRRPKTTTNEIRSRERERERMIRRTKVTGRTAKENDGKGERRSKCK